MRLDLYLFEKKLTESRSRAKNLIELGKIIVNGNICYKPSYEVESDDEIFITEDYSASLGSIKLEKAILFFKPELKNKVCLDLGASNGGFTDILLKEGASYIYALDIGENALPDRLSYNEKIIVMDRTNARYINTSMFEKGIEFITGDLSFISLKIILPGAYNVLKDNGHCIFLIKPQFELDKKTIPKSGIIKNELIRKKIVNDICLFATKIGFKVLGTTEAPHPFANKNQEYLLYLTK